jgi:hypothetical protein
MRDKIPGGRQIIVSYGNLIDQSCESTSDGIIIARKGTVIASEAKQSRRSRVSSNTDVSSLGNRSGEQVHEIASVRSQ